MTTRAFTRRPRIAVPELPQGEISLEPPPELPRPTPVNIMTYVMPAGMVLMVAGMTITGGFTPASMMMGAMMLTMTLGMLGNNRGGGQNKSQLNAERHDYLKYLTGLRDEVADVRRTQIEATNFVHPRPESLWALAGTRRMWERRHHDEDFGELRLGSGSRALATPLRPPQTAPIGEVDPICAVALRRLINTHTEVEDLPFVINLDSFALVSFTGEDAGTLARALICEAATFHGPDTFAIAAVVGPQTRAHWDWLKWLPHNHHESERDGLGPLRMVGSSMDEVEEWLANDIAKRPGFNRSTKLETGDRRVMIVLDGGAPPDPNSLLAAGGIHGVTVLDVRDAMPEAATGSRLDLIMRPEALGARVGDSIRWLGVPDGLGLVEADAVARKIAPYRPSERASAEVGGATSGSNDLVDMLSLGDLDHLTPEQVWRPRGGRDLLRVPIGVGPSGEVVELDLKESAFGGMGPHGLVIGATGSGKSELLRTLVLGLAVTHSPEQLNMVLIDFKGGATFLGLDTLPQTAAVITNLQDDLTMVDRMYDALSGELNRRQEVLRDAGNLANIREYERARAVRPEMPPLPWLVIVVDEFSELLMQKPDFAELFAAIGRLGRSLGVHLLLASQRLEEGRLRGLDSHLSYRVGLKTFSAAESRAVLGVPDAYELPSVPGSGYLKFDTTTMARFKAAYVSGPWVPTVGAATGVRELDSSLRPISFVAAQVDLGEAPAIEAEIVEEEDKQIESAGPESKSVLDTIVGRLHGHGVAPHQVWLPPLEESPPLNTLLPPLVPGPRGLHPQGWDGGGGLRAVYGLVDLPYEQRRDVLVADFSGGAGNGVVVGGPQTGKSTALRTLITSLALTHTPSEVQFYVIDLGGGSLGSTAGLPHVGGVATRADSDRLRRAIAEVNGIMTEREARFAQMGVESMADFRTRRANGDPTALQDPFGDVFLVVDGWGALREEFEDLEPRITGIAARGLSYGVHVLIGSTRWTEVRPAIRDNLGTRIELRLGDPQESEIDRRVAQNVPTSQPGRGITGSKHHLLVGLPRIDGSSDHTTLTPGYADLVAQVNAAWDGPGAREIRTLPERLSLSAIPAPEGSKIPFGINEDALAPVFFDLETDQHLLAFSDVESGKTNLLKVLVKGIMETHSSDDLRFLVADYRRNMLGFIPQEYLAGYASSGAAFSPLLNDLAALLRSRLPGPEVTAEQLRARNWWSGPDVVIVVDDHDMVASGDNPLQMLRDLIPQARDIGMHVLVTRRSSGGSRALYDPVIQSIRDSGSPGLVGSGSKDEGALIGTAKPSPSYPPGRAQFVRRDTVQLVQVAYLEETNS